MRMWDLNAGAAKLELAAKELKKARTRIEAEWDDQAYRQLVEEYLAPLDPILRRAMDSIHRMADVLNQAERECGSY
jgi:hypothetical protein